MPDRHTHLQPSPFQGEGTYLSHVVDVAGVVTELHHHLYHELDYILTGQGVFGVGKQKVNVSAGDMIYLGRGVNHWRMSELDHPVELCTLVIDDPDMERVRQARPSGKRAELPWWRHWSKSELLANAGTRGFLQELVTQMRKRPQTNSHTPVSPIDERVPPADMDRLLPGIAGLLGLARSGGEPGPDLHALARRVRSAPHKHLSLDEEAARLGVSRWWLSRVFKRRFGVTLWEYRDYARTDLAIERLLSSDISVGDLGRSLGFRSTAQFIATFKRLTGLAPGRLRRRYLQVLRRLPP